MNSIKFNQATREIELKGAESFIESNFEMIEDLLTESLGVMKEKRAVATKSDEKPMLWVETIEPNVKEKRPPARKYFNTMGQLIRSEATSINKEQASDPDRPVSQGFSIASLKEKFGLSKKQIEVMVRDAEKQGRARRDLDGSFTLF